MWKIIDKICDFFNNLAEWGVMLLLGIGAIAGISAIYRACGVSHDASTILGIITLAVIIFVIHKITKAQEKKEEKEKVRIAARYNRMYDNDGTSRREKAAQQDYLNAGRKVAEIKRELNSLETRKAQMSEQEYSIKKEKLEGELLIWQDASNLSYKLWQDEAHK